MAEQKTFSSNPNRTFDEIVQLLNSKVNWELSNDFSMQGMEKRLEKLRQLLKIFGSPETRYRTVHVAGTKGKGSTCALLESILVENHYRVGCFSSPHLYTLRERIAINGVPCSEDEFAEQMGAIYDGILAHDPKCFEELTYFELMTLFAFDYFARKQVDVAIFEVGLGGRLDATNICRPDVTVITSISFDHMAQLGPTLAEIAAEKAGIIKPGIPIVSAVRHTESQNVIHRIAKKNIAPEFFLGTAFDIYRSVHHQENQRVFRFQTIPTKFPTDFNLDNLSLRLPGTHQIRNASLAIATALLLSEKTSLIELDTQKIRDGLRKAFLPIRVEIIRSSNTSPVFVVDGAHNHSSIAAFIKTVRREFPGKRLIAVFGVSLGKDVEGMLTELMYNFQQIILTQYSSNPRCFPPKGLKTIASSLPNAPSSIKNEFFQPKGEDTGIMFDSALNYENFPPMETSSTGLCSQIEVIENCREALQRAWATATPDDVICVTGSMFLAAELRQVFFEQWSEQPLS